MLNTAIILCISVGLWQLAIGAHSWPVWAVVLIFLLICKVTDAGGSKPKKRYGRHW